MCEIDSSSSILDYVPYVPLGDVNSESLLFLGCIAVVSYSHDRVSRAH